MKVLETMWSGEVFVFFPWNFDAGNLLDWKVEILVGILNAMTDKKQITIMLISSQTTCYLGAV